MGGGEGKHDDSLGGEGGGISDGGGGVSGEGGQVAATGSRGILANTAFSSSMLKMLLLTSECPEKRMLSIRLRRSAWNPNVQAELV